MTWVVIITVLIQAPSPNAVETAVKSLLSRMTVTEKVSASARGYLRDGRKN